MKLELFVSPKQHFEELVDNGISRFQIRTPKAVQDYLVGLLEFYLDTRNLFPAQNLTLAETYLQSAQMDSANRREALKQMGDRCLYVSGFFSDSLQRKLVDVDYYADMGVAAYGQLAGLATEDTTAQVYRVFSKRFLEFVDVLSFISQKSLVQTDESVLRLYDRYLRTGSTLARERLEELGVVTLPTEQVKKAHQD